MSDTPVLKRLLLLRMNGSPSWTSISPIRIGRGALRGLPARTERMWKKHRARPDSRVVSGMPRWLEAGKVTTSRNTGSKARSLSGEIFRGWPRPPLSQLRSNAANSGPGSRRRPRPSRSFLTLASGDLVLGATPGFAGKCRSADEGPEPRRGRGRPDLEAFLREILQERREAFHRFLRLPRKPREDHRGSGTRFRGRLRPRPSAPARGLDTLLAPSNLRVDFAPARRVRFSPTPEWRFPSDDWAPRCPDFCCKRASPRP